MVNPSKDVQRSTAVRVRTNGPRIVAPGAARRLRGHRDPLPRRGTDLDDLSRRDRGGDLRIRSGAALAPPSVNLSSADPRCDLAYGAGTGRAADAEVLRTISLGFGGINASLFLRKHLV